MTSVEKIAKILRADKDTISTIQNVMGEKYSSGKYGVLDKIVEENTRIIKEKLNALGVGSDKAKDIYEALLERIQEDDKKIDKILGYPVCVTEEGCRTLLDAAGGAADVPDGVFLKIEKAKEFLSNCPPINILKTTGYKNVDELLKKEDILEIFSALRFVEDKDWLNNVFFKQYENLKPSDFEVRKIKAIVLGERWKDIAEKFLKKKYHNISHLKELGVIFVLPAVLRIRGETLRTLGLVLHYFHEIDFYSKLFQKYAKGENFAQKVISSLKGDVLEKSFTKKDLGKKWMIVQRYLAKDDENDWRLFHPHINPEAVHWRKAEHDISKLGENFSELNLSFWKELGSVGDYYPTDTGIDILVSFNLVDTVMSLVMEKQAIKYLYHHQEAMWNKIFYEYVGEEKMEQMIVDNFDKGYIELDLQK